ncbi:MAG: hypothetical protein JWQ40_4191 [Segetibacter sp.]|jgi:hypothetical protein|nr:hypothetical protein [Segetibacter sp.]
MLQNKKLPAGALLLAGAAAFAYYKYSKMSADEKTKIVSDLKEKGQNLYEKYMPQEVKNMFAKDPIASAKSHFGEGNDYSS